MPTPPPTLDYLPNRPPPTTALAISWLNGIACIYILFAILSLIGFDRYDPAHPWNLVQTLFSLLLLSATATIFLLTARRLRRGTPRIYSLPFWTILLNLAWFAAAIAQIAWYTFSGTIDPGVPLFGIATIILLALFPLLFLSPLLYYLLKAHRQQKQTP